MVRAGCTLVHNKMCTLNFYNNSCLVVPAFICIDLLISRVLKINDDDDDDDDELWQV